jgi:hypothetical protein
MSAADDDRITPQSYVVATVTALWDNLPQVVIGGLWFSLWAAPAFVLAVFERWALAALAAILLAAPGWTSLLAWEAALATGRVPAWSLLPRAWRGHWAISARLAAVALFPLAVVYWWLAQTAAAAPGWVRALQGIAWLYAVVWLAAFLLYALPAVALYGWDRATALRNGLLLAATFPTHTVGLIALYVLCYLAIVRLNGGLIFFLPAIAGLFVVNHIRLAVSLATAP